MTRYWKNNKILDGEPVHLLLSDMAPNISGNKEVDQPKAIYLGELALDAAQAILSKGGVFLIKMFQGEGFDDYHNQVKQHFTSVAIRKPKASRSRSNEVYILAKGFKLPESHLSTGTSKIQGIGFVKQSKIGYIADLPRQLPVGKRFNIGPGLAEA